MIWIYAAARVLCTAAICCAIAFSDITTGWKVFTIILVSFIGFGFDVSTTSRPRSRYGRDTIEDIK